MAKKFNNSDPNQELIGAACLGKLDRLIKALKNGANINYYDDYGVTGLMRASMYGHIELVNHFIENKAKLNLRNSDGNTALMAAAYEGQLECIKALLLAGADYKLINDDELNASHCAIENYHYDISEFIESFIEYKEHPEDDNRLINF